MRLVSAETLPLSLVALQVYVPVESGSVLLRVNVLVCTLVPTLLVICALAESSLVEPVLMTVLLNNQSILASGKLSISQLMEAALVAMTI